MKTCRRDDSEDLEIGQVPAKSEKRLTTKSFKSEIERERRISKKANERAAARLPNKILGWRCHYESFLDSFFFVKGKILVLASPDRTRRGTVDVDAEQQDGTSLSNRSAVTDVTYTPPLTAAKLESALAPVLREIETSNARLAKESSANTGKRRR